ncbi:MAG: 4-hydroxy-tetrahydrodipicolinate reductase [Bacteroidota bacterium]
MKIILSGYGKMGKELEKAALQQGHDIILILDNESDWKKYDLFKGTADVAIDFSMPQCAAENIFRFFEKNIPVITGTTGWHKRFEEVKSYCIQNKQALLYASNFSIGMNIMFAMNEKISELMNAYPDYDVRIEETHHTQKMDSPSGTAIALANDIIKHLERKKEWTGAPPAFNNFLEIKSFRVGNNNGIHNVMYSSANDELEIKHTAKNRSGFATGALAAALWIQNKKGVFGMKDMLNI